MLGKRGRMADAPKAAELVMNFLRCNSNPPFAQKGFSESRDGVDLSASHPGGSSFPEKRQPCQPTQGNPVLAIEESFDGNFRELPILQVAEVVEASDPGARAP